MCIPWIIKILLTTNLQQKSPCPPCVPWITKISGSPTYKKKRRYSHTTSSALHKNPYLIYFFSCKYTNKTDTLQIFPYIFLFLFVKSNFLFNFAAELLNWLARIRAASFHDALRVWRVCPARHFYIL